MTVKVPLNGPLNVKPHVTLPSFPPPEQVSTVELFEKVALIPITMSDVLKTVTRRLRPAEPAGILRRQGLNN